MADYVKITVNKDKEEEMRYIKHNCMEIIFISVVLSYLVIVIAGVGCFVAYNLFSRYMIASIILATICISFITGVLLWFIITMILYCTIMITSKKVLKGKDISKYASIFANVAPEYKLIEKMEEDGSYASAAILGEGNRVATVVVGTSTSDYVFQVFKNVRIESEEFKSVRFECGKIVFYQ